MSAKIVTAVLQIGNSDDKLTQVEWAEFVKEVQFKIDTVKISQHFFGGAANWMPWQNVCWVFTMRESNATEFKRRMAKLREEFKQDSVALTVGDTEFV